MYTHQIAKSNMAYHLFARTKCLKQAVLHVSGPVDATASHYV